MKKVTTTKKIKDALANSLLEVTKAECHYKSSDRVDEINSDTFIENLQLLSESGIFADAIGWHYGMDAKSNGYIVECGRMNPDTEIIVTVYLSIGENANVEDIERTLLFEEF